MTNEINNARDFGSREPFLGFSDGNVDRHMENLSKIGGGAGYIRQWADSLPRCQQEPACVFEDGHLGKHSMGPTPSAVIDRIVVNGSVLQELARQQMEAIAELRRLFTDLQAENEALRKRIAELKL